MIKTTFKEILGVTTILLMWALSIAIIQRFVNLETSLLWILLTIPGLYCWTDSMIKLQKYEGRRKEKIK